MLSRRLYTKEDLDSAVELYTLGRKLKDVCAMFPNIPRRTISERAKKAKDGTQIKKPGPKPILTKEMEEDLQSWVISMQSNGVPVSRDIILVKGNEIYRTMYGNTRSIGFLGRGWLDRFMERHPFLTIRTSQVIKRVWAEATKEGLRIFLMKC